MIVDSRRRSYNLWLPKCPLRQDPTFVHRRPSGLSLTGMWVDFFSKDGLCIKPRNRPRPYIIMLSPGEYC